MMRSVRSPSEASTSPEFQVAVYWKPWPLYRIGGWGAWTTHGTISDRDAPDSVTVQSTERLDERSMYIGKEIIKEIESRLRFLALGVRLSHT